VRAGPALRKLIAWPLDTRIGRDSVCEPTCWPHLLAALYDPRTLQALRGRGRSDTVSSHIGTGNVMAREQRRLAAIVSTDVAGYSRLMGRDESGTLAALKALWREIVDPQIAAHGGRIVKTTGDGLLLEFPSVVDAVRCVVEVQTAMASSIADVPEDRRIAFRIGINLGDIIVDGDDIFGDGVNTAARLQEIAAPGGMCVSSRVHDDVRDRLDIEFEDGGMQALKNIARPVQVWRWSRGASVPAQAIAATTHVPLTLPDKPSIAVLPFQNMSGDPEQEYFSHVLAVPAILSFLGARVPCANEARRQR